MRSKHSTGQHLVMPGKRLMTRLAQWARTPRTPDPRNPFDWIYGGSIYPVGAIVPWGFLLGLVGGITGVLLSAVVTAPFVYLSYYKWFVPIKAEWRRERAERTARREARRTTGSGRNLR